jgi:PAS domain S-box-containing protein
MANRRHRLPDAFPVGAELPRQIWQTRHTIVLWVIFLQAVALVVFGAFMGWGWPLALAEGGAVAALGAVAAWPRLSLRWRSSFAALACVTASAVLVQFSGGYIEAHFHFFVMVALITLYQDWVPFLIAVAYVAVDHGVVGTLAPNWVYNHPHALANPWEWAAIHAAMVLAQAAALLAFWSGAEKARARSDLLLASAGEPIIGLDGGGNIEFLNPAAARLFGPAANLVGKPLASRLARPDGGPVALLSIEGSPAIEGLVRRPDGTATPVEWTVTPAPRSDDSVAHVVALRDLTERKRAERERLERLLSQDRFKTQLLNTASHELNTPISVLQLQLHLLKTHVPDCSPAAREALTVLDRNVDRLGVLVRSTLDVARIESGQLRLDVAPVDMAQVVAETHQAFADAAAQRGVALSWSGPRQATLEADAGRLTQVLFNLVSNALKFTPPGGIVQVEVQAGDDTVCVRVRDSGVGLTREQASRLFQPFSQVHEGQGYGGTGLGLYITKGIVELHGGRVWHESQGPGHGSLFGFEVPRAPAASVLQPTPVLAGASAGRP